MINILMIKFSQLVKWNPNQKIIIKKKLNKVKVNLINSIWLNNLINVFSNCSYTDTGMSKESNQKIELFR